MGAKVARRSLALLVVAGALLCVASAALAQTPASVPATPEPSLSATPPVAAPPPAAPQPNAPASPPAGRPAVNGPTITITQQDSGRTFNVSLNQQVIVQLGATLDWSVSYQPQGILLAVPGVNTLTRGTQAILYAAAPGTATITAQGRAICTAGQPCPQFVTQFQATVIVAGTAAQQPSAPGVGQQSPPSASPPSQPIRLPNTGGESGDAPVPQLIGIALLLALAGVAAWRRVRR
jgi:MYXO-CTERM domain-containing protein